MSTPPQEPGDQHGAPGPQQPQQPPQYGAPQQGPPGYGASQQGAPQPGAQPQVPSQQPPAAGQWQSSQQAPGGSGGGSAEAIDAKGFFAALFDWRFHTLITPKIVSIVYLVGMVLIGLMWLGFLISAFSTEPILGLVVLIIGPIVAVVYLAFWRMTLELYFAIVRMSDDIHRSSGAPRV